MRTLVIGDIHSGLKALKQVLQRAGANKKDRLIFLGDYVDGWSEAVETIAFLILLNKSHNCCFLRGNHDALCYDWMVQRVENPMWLHHGGAATVASYAEIKSGLMETHMKFFEQLVDYHLDKENRLFLHAGFTNIKGVEHEYFTKTFYWDRTLWEMALALNPGLEKDDPLYPKRLLHYKEIFIGHAPVTRLGKTSPQRAANVWNIDTGAAFRGPLSIIDADTKEIWQSDPVYSFYPTEKGRN